MEKYKKRYNRLKKRYQDTKHPLHQSTFKSYLLYLTIVKNIRQRYRCAKSHSERKFIASLVTRQRILKRYGISAFAQEQLKISRRHIEQKSFRKPNVEKLRLWEQIKMFYKRHDVSRMTSDKKSTMTRRGLKKQLRFLNDDMKTLHQKFVSEHKTVSYSLFCKLRPFWVVKPRQKTENMSMQTT